VIIGHGASHPGNVRQINEDVWRLEAPMGLCLVADGMGGHNAGEVASDMAADAIVNFLRCTYEGEDVTWPYGIDPELSFDANRLVTAIRLGNRRVFRAAESHDEYTGMGTTVVAALIDVDRLSFAGVGDSRVYLFRDGRLEQLTVDDSWVARLPTNDPRVEPAAQHPMRHVLTNVVGARAHVDFEVMERALKDGDALLLCSDGLHGELDDATIARIMGSSDDPQAVADQLVQTALAGRAGDNITAVVVRYKRG
jgi:protein phosphatase